MKSWFRYAYPQVHGSISHCSQNVETAQVSVDRHTDEPREVNTYSGLLYVTKELLTHHTTRVNLEDLMTNTVWFHLYDVSKVVKVRKVVARDCGRENGKLGFKGDRVFHLGRWNVPELDGGNGCTIMWIYMMPLTCTPKNSYTGKCCIYFTTI